MREEAHQDVQSKKGWTAPQLTIYGTVEEITAQSIPVKQFGPGDGAAWQGQPVHWATS